MTSHRTGPEGVPETTGIRGLRIISGVALALLPVMFMLAFGLALDDALNGESTVLFYVGAWIFAASGLLGLAVLLLPARRVSRPVRIALLAVQCGLMPVALALAAAA